MRTPQSGSFIVCFLCWFIGRRKPSWGPDVSNTAEAKGEGLDPVKHVSAPYPKVIYYLSFQCGTSEMWFLNSTCWYIIMVMYHRRKINFFFHHLQGSIHNLIKIGLLVLKEKLFEILTENRHVTYRQAHQITLTSRISKG